jgi:hypothetical protein
MHKHSLLALILVWFAMTAPPSAAEPPQVIFNLKAFDDFGHTVHVEGTLTGDGIGYKNNRSSLTCFQDSRECLAVHIETQGMQVFSIGMPVTFTVREWTADRIVADFGVPCGDAPSTRVKQEWQTTQSDTWLIDRTRKTAELIEHPCLGAKTYHWTIEDPEFWKKATDGLGDSKSPG